jgi:RNase P protein component
MVVRARPAAYQATFEELDGELDQWLASISE